MILRFEPNPSGMMRMFSNKRPSTQCLSLFSTLTESQWKVSPTFTQVMLVDKDARRMDVVRKPDGTPPDLPRPADILVYEVCALSSPYSPCLHQR